MAKNNKFLSFCLSLAVLAFLSACGFNSPHKSDKELITNLQTGKDKFNLLLKMLEEDKDLERISLTGVGYNFQKTKFNESEIQQISPERIAEYRKILSELSLTLINVNPIKDNGKLQLVEFFSTTHKYTDDHAMEYYSHKLYVWRPVTAVTSTEPLDSFQRDPNFEGTKYRRIDENWALSYYAHKRNSESEGY